LIALLRRFEADAARETGRRAFERRKREAPAAVAPSIAAPVLSRRETAPPLLAKAAPEPVIATAASGEDLEIAVDLAALERELIAA
jgi:hypothetical protein